MFVVCGSASLEREERRLMVQFLEGPFLGTGPKVFLTFTLNLKALGFLKLGRGGGHGS